MAAERSSSAFRDKVPCVSFDWHPFFEPPACRAGMMDGVLGVAMAEAIVDKGQVMALAGQRVGPQLSAIRKFVKGFER